LFHNFLWHLHTTWGDRCNGCNHSTQAGKLFRFHLSNGLVSMIGNLAIMSTHVHGAHVPLLAANLVAILTCSLVNFCLANQWVF
jgi:putative flippase GtrA